MNIVVEDDLLEVMLDDLAQKVNENLQTSVDDKVIQIVGVRVN